MQKRRSHKKSRNGCQNCKKWHTKCDESGPPCNNCTLRKAKCVYNKPKTDGTNDNNSLTLRSKDGSATTNPLFMERPQGDVGSLCAAYGGPSRLLELELMHQWSTKTYKAFCSQGEDIIYLRDILPRSSLNYDFMLNCLMSISSLHIANTLSNKTDAMKYINAGLEYYNRGSISFRKHLGSLNADNCDVLYMFSAIAVSVHLSIPQRCANALDLLKLACDLVGGSANIGMMAMPWLLNSIFPLRAFISRIGASKDLIDADCKAALARLRSLNDQLNKPTSNSSSDIETQKHGDVVVSNHEIYELAIQALEASLAEEARGLLSGFATAFPVLAGKPFVAMVTKAEPFALLIIMYWTVTLQEVNLDIWWAKPMGVQLASEIADLLVMTHPALALEWAQDMAWVLDRVGVPPSPQLSQLSYSSGTEASCWEIT
ncbi:uncharacterized protein F4822DRAFT_407630 [Hypoxylon trugodes]|uniref:uncharacterized protein n=1 Tax=Hypoxylon trugodes TaxID=326681 RepID=UPI002194C5FC|nr:uncharacterized protein F4822DRAFT_407630 [Hypoxylon trugodes]KAI1387805.1 hypothetical protein F4822DRAFT_407630 [Hypoxylon trugodes]